MTSKAWMRQTEIDKERARQKVTEKSNKAKEIAFSKEPGYEAALASAGMDGGGWGEDEDSEMVEFQKKVLEFFRIASEQESPLTIHETARIQQVCVYVCIDTRTCTQACTFRYICTCTRTCLITHMDIHMTIHETVRIRRCTVPLTHLTCMSHSHVSLTCLTHVSHSHISLTHMSHSHVSLICLTHMCTVMLCVGSHSHISRICLTHMCVYMYIDTHTSTQACTFTYICTCSYTHKHMHITFYETVRI